jgi:hypothetical protein
MNEWVTRGHQEGIYAWQIDFVKVGITCSTFVTYFMATPVILGVSAVAAAILGRSIIQRGLFLGKNGAEQWVKGGFRAKMDRKEAIAILGLKYARYRCHSCS